MQMAPKKARARWEGARVGGPNPVPLPEYVLRFPRHSTFQALGRNLPKNPSKGPALWAPSAPKTTHPRDTIRGVPDSSAQRGWHRSTPTTHASPYNLQTPGSTHKRAREGNFRAADFWDPKSPSQQARRSPSRPFPPHGWARSTTVWASILPSTPHFLPSRPARGHLG